MYDIERPLTFTDPSDDLGPRLDACVLSVGIPDSSLASPFEDGSDRLRIQESFDRALANLICIVGLISTCDGVVTPALLCMLTQVTRRLGITCIQEPSHSSRSVLAFLCSTVKDVVSSAILTTTGWNRTKKCVHGSCPLLGKSFCYTVCVLKLS